MSTGKGRDSRSQGGGSRRHSPVFIIVWSLVALLTFSGFLALGTWQVYRLDWKLDLIDRVDQRVSAPAQPAPGPSQWSQISAENHAYQHVKVTGTFVPDKTSFVKASTKLGSGFWVLTPLRRADNTLVLINRGFVTDKSSTTPAPKNSGDTSVTGLLRISIPGGGFLRDNDPDSERWYSRDVQAIAKAKGLDNIAPYFIDAEADGNQVPSPSLNQAYREPVGGLTVIDFRNSHLIYALTWYTLAAMVAAGAFWIAREEYRAWRSPKEPSEE